MILSTSLQYIYYMRKIYYSKNKFLKIFKKIVSLLVIFSTNILVAGKP